MVKKTLRDHAAAALTELGYTVDKSRSRRWTASHPNKEERYFLGKAGSIRKGRNFVTSIPAKLPT